MKHFFFLLISLFMLNSISAQGTAENKTDDKGRKQGLWTKMDKETSKKIYTGSFKDDKPEGKFIYYYKGSDTVHTVMYFQKDGKTAYAVLYHDNGKLQAKGKYINEKKDSIWNFYDYNGKLVSSEGYKEGKKNGKSTIYFDDGTVSETRQYKDDLEDGPFVQYFDGKTKKGEGNYKAGKLVGKNTYWFPNGTIAATGNYNAEGNKNGVWLYKDKEGKIKSKEVWQNGKELTGKEAEEYLKKNKQPDEKPSKNPNSGGKKPVTKNTKTGGK